MELIRREEGNDAVVLLEAEGYSVMMIEGHHELLLVREIDPDEGTGTVVDRASIDAGLERAIWVEADLNGTGTIIEG